MDGDYIVKRWSTNAELVNVKKENVKIYSWVLKDPPLNTLLIKCYQNGVLFTATGDCDNDLRLLSKEIETKCGLLPSEKLLEKVRMDALECLTVICNYVISTKDPPDRMCAMLCLLKYIIIDKMTMESLSEVFLEVNK